MRSGLRRSRMHDERRAASPSFFSTPRSTSTPASDESCPPSNPTLNFLPATDGRSNGRRVSSLMTGVALLNWSVSRSRNQNHESNCGFPLHPSLISLFWVNKKRYRPLIAASCREPFLRHLHSHPGGALSIRSGREPMGMLKITPDVNRLDAYESCG